MLLSSCSSSFKQHTDQGYRYVRLEQVTTTVAGTSGCFGVGATPATMRSLSMVVFEQKPVGLPAAMPYLEVH